MIWRNLCTQSHGVARHKIGGFIFICVCTANFNFGIVSYFRIRYRFEHLSTAKLSCWLLFVNDRFEVKLTGIPLNDMSFISV
jgi:hypothetical protein